MMVLFLNYIVLLWTKLSCMAVIICSPVLSENQNQVFVVKDVIDGELYLKCSVCNLDHDIMLFSPSYNPDAKEQNYFAICTKPRNVDTGKVVCDEPKNTIHLDTKTATFMLGSIGSFNEYGNWTCAHGSSTGYITLEPPDKNTDGDTCIGRIIIDVATLLGVIIVIKLFLRFVAPKILKLWRNRGRSPSSEEKTPLLDEVYKCETCNEQAFCAVCYTCHNLYCETCWQHHTKKKEHYVFQIEHAPYTANRSDVKCHLCQANVPEEVCIRCKYLFCHSCKCNCKERKIRKLVEPPGKIKTANSVAPDRRSHPSIKKLSQIFIADEDDKKSIRICGISVLLDRRIIVADAGNENLRVFKLNENLIKTCKFGLRGEPRGLARIEKNKIAVSFAYEREIRIFNVKTTMIEELEEEKLCLSDIGKPFDIAFHSGHFAIETGEGNDGFITILKKDGTEVCRITNEASFGYFTGNTMRLALNMDDQLVYVSAMSIKKVSCVRFDRSIKWSHSVPSPRGIIHLPLEQNSQRTIMLASKRCKAVYLVNEDSGKDEILLSEEDLKAPRYIAYDEKERLFWVNVDQNEIYVYEFDWKIMVEEQFNV